jgi:SAM-dependent methyltransferase
MLQKMFMQKVYQKAEKPADLLWHSEEPSKFLVAAMQRRGGPGSALDLGCGAGIFSVFLAKNGYQVTGLDFIPKALEMADQHAQKEKVKVKWVQADLLEYNDSQLYDIILDSGCLHTIVNKEKYKEQILKWLAPGGDFILGHFGRRNFFDWRPVGPIRRGKKELERFFAPELRMIGYDETVQTGVPFPIGPSVQLQSLWFVR